MQVNVQDAKTQLSRLLSLVEAGEDVVIARYGKPVARLVPADAPKPKRRRGTWRNSLRVSDDFNDELDLLDLPDLDRTAPIEP